MKDDQIGELTKLLLIVIISNLYVLCYGQAYPIVDTNVSEFYSENAIISAPEKGQRFYGQDAHYSGHQPSYTDNGDGTITDEVTGLMWEKDMGDKISYDAAFSKASNSNLGGHSDWRVPTIKELYSLAQFTGRCFGDKAVLKFIDTIYFNQPIGNTSIGEREIDAQTWSSTQYVGLIMRGDTAVFGYNFVDGRLKAYPKYKPQDGTPNTMFFRMVRGNTSYGINDFINNGDGTITDSSTGLMWQQSDDGNTRDWEASLSYCENLTLGGYSDWRLPNAKELQSIIDYSRTPAITGTPAIDPLFSCTSFNNPEGNLNFGYYWTSSPLQDGPSPYTDAVYVCFGEAQGQMSFPPNNIPEIYDTHGAGAQRNDPKEVGTGIYPQYHGPQGDILYVNNYTRAVRDVTNSTSLDEFKSFNFNIYPNPAQNQIAITTENITQTIIIYDAVGNKMIELSTDSKTTIINTSTLVNGMYFLKILSKDSISKAKKVIIFR